MPNIIGNSDGGNTVGGGIREGSFVNKATGDVLLAKNLSGQCPVKILTEFRRDVTNANNFTCAYYDPEINGLFYFYL